MHAAQPRMNWGPALGLAIAAVWVGTLGACVPRELAPGPDADQPIPVQLAPAELITGDGYVLPVRSWLPESGDGAMAPKAVVVALHGFNDYSNAFAGPGAWLAERGIAVYAFDQRGFGATADRGMWPGTETMIDDLRAMIARLRSQYADVPLYGLGESMGGAVMLTGWAQEPFDLDGIILAGPAVWGRAGMPGYMQTGLWIFAHTLPWLRLSPENLDYIPSDNIEMLRALGRDPLVIKETRVDAMWGLVNLMDSALNAADDFDAPSLIMTGVHDEIVPPYATQSFLSRLNPGADQRIAIYPKGYHMLLRDLDAETVWRDIKSWIDDPQAPLPSGADDFAVDALGS